MVINSKIQQKRGGGKCHSPMVLHGKITTCREIKEHNYVDSRTGENLREVGAENNISATLKFRGGM